jgi:hypothetical protein
MGLIMIRCGMAVKMGMLRVGVRKMKALRMETVTLIRKDR